jgi:4-carboxymuconolactone decarboxylase
MPRIPLFPMDDMSAEQRRVLEEIVSGPRGRIEGPLRAALHRPELADPWQKLGAVLRYGSSLPPRLSELAILVTARRWNCQFEWWAHEPHALKAGLAPEVIAALREGSEPVFKLQDEAAVHRYAHELLQSGSVGDAAYRAVLDLYGTLGPVDLTALVGYYSMVAMTLNAHELPLPEGVAPPLSLGGPGKSSGPAQH